MSDFRKSKLPPEPQNERKRRQHAFRFRALLCILSGLFLGFSFPPFPVGILACFGLVPLLIVLADLDDIGTQLRFSYLTFLVFHVITVNWTGGYAHMKDVYMMIAGGANMIVHPLFYFIPIGAYVLVKKYLGPRVALVALPLIWVAYEYSHSLSEWSFPWLTLGNSQSYDIGRIQFISVTGVFGLSLWILVMNVLAFVFYSGLAQQKFTPLSRSSFRYVAVIFLVYLLPRVHGQYTLSQNPAGTASEKSITVGMVQSNIDPWEKWQMSGFDAVKYYLEKTEHLSRGTVRPDLVLWPETAVTYYFLTPASDTFRRYLQDEVNRIGVPVLTGFQHAVFYDDSTQAPPSAKRMKTTGQRYDAFNAAAFIQPGVEEIPWYGKMKMVPIAERVPYADAFHFLDFLRWDVGIGGWQIGPDSVIFVEKKTGAKFCTMICYESTYPGFVAAFVRKGAEFISIITIDSWWGRMSGAFQHHQFAIFRAVENHRWVARCAVGGISSFIDPFGRVYDKTELFTEALLQRTIGREEKLSFYTEHGDWLGQGCAIFAGLLVAAAAGQGFKNKKRKEA